MSIKKKLKQALQNAGLEEGLSEIINIETEDQIEGIIKRLTPSTSEDEIDFSKILKSKEFTDFVSEKGIEKVLGTSDALQKEFDKKVTGGITKFKKKFLKDEDDDLEEELEEGGEGNNKSLLAMIAKLSEKVDGIGKKTETETKLANAKKFISESETLNALPEKLKARYLKGIQFDSETSVEDQIKEFEEEAADLNFSNKQSNKGLPIGGTPLNGKKASDDETKKLVGKFF